MKTSAKTKTVELKLYAPEANRVNLAGDFNRWDADSILAKKDSKGTWKTKLNLQPGRYEYKFVVDGSWRNDPTCNGCVPNSFGTSNCVIIVR